MNVAFTYSFDIVWKDGAKGPNASRHKSTLQEIYNALTARKIPLGDAWTTLELQALEAAGTPAENDLYPCADGDSGNRCLAIYTFGSFKRISIGAAISTS